MGVVCLILLFLSAILISFSIEVSVFLDLFANDCRLKIALFFIPLVDKKVRVSRDDYGKYYLEFNCDKNDNNMAKTPQNDNNIDRRLIGKFLGCISVDSFAVDITVGIKNDAFLTAISVALVRSVLYGIMAYLKNDKNTVIFEKFVADYNKDSLKINIKSIISVKIADIIISLISKPTKRRVMNDNRA